MRDTRLDQVAEACFRLVPLWTAKLLRPLEHTASDGLSGLQFLVLTRLGRVEAAPAGELARHLMVSKSNITSVVDRLVAGGFVIRVAAPSDRRVVNVIITDAGRSAVGRCKQKMKETIVATLAGLPDESLDALMASLDTVYSIISELD